MEGETIKLVMYTFLAVAIALTLIGGGIPMIQASISSVMDFIGGKSAADIESAGESRLQEAINCAYYRCKSGCEVVAKMTWNYLGTDTGTTKLFYCCVKDPENVWVEDTEDCRVVGAPSSCESKPTCQAKCSLAGYKEGELVGEDAVGGYCECSIPEKGTCPCDLSWDSDGDGRICEESSEHPIKVELSENTFVYREDPINYIFKITNGCTIEHIHGNSLNIKNDSIVENSCNKDTDYRTLYTYSECVLKKDTFYVWAGESTLAGISKDNPNIVICDSPKPGSGGTDPCNSYETQNSCEDANCNWCGCYVNFISSEGVASNYCSKETNEDSCSELSTIFGYTGTFWVGCENY